MTDNITFDDGFHQTSFLGGLQFIPNAILGNEIPLPNYPANFYSSNNLGALPASAIPYYLYSANTSVAARTQADRFNQFLSGYSIPNIPGPTGASKSFTNFADFQSGLYTALGIGQNQGLYQGLVQEFAAALNIQIDSNGNVTGGDWQILTTPPAASPPVNFFSSNSNNPFILAFNDFLSKYQYPASTLSGDLGFLKSFITQWHQYLSNISLLVAPATSDPAVFQDLSTYQAIFNAYSKDTSISAFKARLNQFYQDEINTKGYFMPSQMLADWVTAIRNENGVNMNLELIGSSLAGNSSEKALVLNRIILLLISIIKTLQDVGIAQANRLTYLTKYQNVYTALQTQIPVFLKDGSNPLGKSSTEAGQTRNDLNSSFNGILTDNMRSLRGIQEDNAKKLQSNVNATNDAVNQQTDMASTFIQQMSTLLSTILR